MSDIQSINIKVGDGFLNKKKLILGSSISIEQFYDVYFNETKTKISKTKFCQ